MWPQAAAMNSSGDQAFPLPLPKRHGQWWKDLAEIQAPRMAAEQKVCTHRP